MGSILFLDCDDVRTWLIKTYLATPFLYLSAKALAFTGERRGMEGVPRTLYPNYFLNLFLHIWSHTQGKKNGYEWRFGYLRPALIKLEILLSTFRFPVP